MARRRSLARVALIGLAIAGVVTSAAWAGSNGNETRAVAQATIKVAKSPLGTILVDGNGRTLYMTPLDTPGQIRCTTAENCTKLWAPLLTTAKPHAGPGVSAGLLGTIKRTKPPGIQVTYNGHPLYRYTGDLKPGDLNGQGFFSNWYVLSPKGAVIKKKTY